MNLLALSASVPSPLQQLLSTLQLDMSTGSGQTSPTDATDQATTAPASSPKPAGSASSQFSTDTLSALLAAQEGPPSASSVASNMIGSLDTNGDGSLSLDEVEQALNGGSTSSTSTSTTAEAQAFAKLDTNGDGELSADELTAALNTMQQDQTQQSQGHHGGHHHHHHVDSSADASATTTSTSATNTSAATTAASSSTTDATTSTDAGALISLAA